MIKNTSRRGLLSTTALAGRLLAVAGTAMVLLAGAAHAGGGRGGDEVGQPSSGGSSGVDNPTGAGGAGGNGNASSGGGGGGAGASSGGAGGSAGPGGAGGVGGVHGHVGATLPVGAATGSSGAAGSAGLGGGGGGAGGYGAVVTGTGTAGIVSGSITAGNGGAGGNGNGAHHGGSGGSGGIGLAFTEGSSTSTVSVNGAIRGGDGGAGSSFGSHDGAAGAGGAGIVGANLNITNFGTITGGLAGDGATQAAAIRFTGGTNTLTFGNATSGLTGGIVVDTGTLTFAQPSNVVLGSAISGAGAVIKSGTGDLTLSGTNTYSGATHVTEGRLIATRDTALSERSDYTIASGATLELAAPDWHIATIGSLAGAGNLKIGGANSTLAIGKNNASTVFSGTISGTGSLSMIGAGKLSLTGTSVLEGSLKLEGNASPTVEIDGGSLTLGTSSGWAMATNEVASGLLRVTNGGTLNLLDPMGTLSVKSAMEVSGANSTVNNDSYTDIGGTSEASLTIKGGAVMNSKAGAIIEGHGGSLATVTVTGPGSTWNIDQHMFLGNRWNGGNGALVISAGGTVNLDGSLYYDLSPSPGVPGSSVIVTGTGSRLNVADELAIGIECFCGDPTSTLTVADGGIVDVSGMISVGDTSVINIGTGQLAGTIIAPEIANHGRIVADFTDSTTISADISGAGSLTKQGSGKLIMTGDNTYTGATTVTQGILQVDGLLAGSGGVTISGRGILGGIGTLGSAGSTVTIASGATHAPGKSIGTQTVAGNYVNHGTLQIEATPTNADKLIVAGSVDISGATLDLLLSPMAIASWDISNGPFTLIDKQGAGAITGVFGQVTSDLIFLAPTVDYNGGDGNDVTLKLDRRAFASIGRTSNQIATGAAIEALPTTSAVWKAVVVSTSTNAARAAFDQLSGEFHASAKTALIQDSRFVRNAVNDRLRAAFETAGTAAVPVLAYGPGAVAPPVSATHSGPVFWSQGFGAWGSTGGDGNAARLDSSTGGVLGGTDILVGDWRVGLTAGYSHSSFNTEARAAQGSSENYHLGVYGGTKWGAVAFRGGLAYTLSDIDGSRTVGFPGFSDALRYSYHAGAAQAFGELGYGIEAGQSAFEPFANLAYINLHTDGFAEQGGAAALTVAGGSTDVTFSTIGLRASTRFTLAGIDATARGMLGWRHAFGNPTPLSVNAFGGSGTFSVAGAPIAGDSAIAEAGLDFDISPAASIGLSYHGQLASNAQDHGFKANLAVQF
ncbi:autotransporter domain-containing protein [Aminobacter sp. UC22_36]|uniref:autotransporter domain-containing protein n=1 Tax=Aminobacter sp. UC22_36 TaxID=3374549 RepID=UPI00375781FD